jgi:hypothetical protein
MSYQDANRIFGDIENHATSASDPVAFDLSNGLRALSQALAEDSRLLRERLALIESRLQAIEARLPQSPTNPK